jgi:hypothetical protein
MNLVPEAVRKIKLPASAKQEAQEFLDVAGISPFSVFPDVVGLAPFIKNLVGLSDPSPANV